MAIQEEESTIDQNLSGFVATSVTLYQSWWALLITALIGPISAFIGAYAVYRTSQKAYVLQIEMMLQKERQERRNKQRQAYYRLRGLEFLLGDLYKTYSHIFFESQSNLEASQKYYEDAKKIDPSKAENALLESQAYKQYQEAYQRSFKLSLELIKSRKNLWELLGTIEGLFPKTTDLIDKISKIEAMEKQYKIKDWSKEQPEKREYFVEVFLNTCYAPTVNDLLSYLLNEIGKVEGGEFI